MCLLQLVHTFHDLQTHFACPTSADLLSCSKMLLQCFFSVLYCILDVSYQCMNMINL
jgi:hypothetical protein